MARKKSLLVTIAIAAVITVGSLHFSEAPTALFGDAPAWDCPHGNCIGPGSTCDFQWNWTCCPDELGCYGSHCTEHIQDPCP